MSRTRAASPAGGGDGRISADREYGIPAVVGVKGATKMIGGGQQVEIRGEEGKVIIIGA